MTEAADRTSRLAASDKQFVWHPFTQMREWNEAEPLIIDRAEGHYLIDTEGRRYFDGVASLWVNVHGHGHPEISRAIEQQLAKVAHSTLLGLANVPAIELAERLVEVAPAGLSKVFYSDSGSTAVEIALKMAFQYWQLRGRSQKRRFMSLAEAYHGDTIGAISVGGIELFHSLFGPLLFERLVVPTPHSYRDAAGRTPEQCRDDSLAALEAQLKAHGHELAAFIIEPLVQGAAGMLVQPEGYLRRVAELCKQYDVLLIADEVATGFGRTGKMFACEHEGVQPDLLCLAKGITGGYLPLAATLASEEIYDAFLGARAEGRQFFHGHTYTGNPVACAAAIASLQLFDGDRLLQQVRDRAALLQGELAEQLGSLPWVGDIRQRGLMVGVELVQERDGGTPFPGSEFVGARVCEAIRKHGVILRPLGDVVVVMPPLTVKEQELRSLVANLRTAISDTLG